MTTQALLVVSGAIFEVIGIALVAAGDLVPGARRVAVWGTTYVSRFRRWLAHTVLRRPGSVTHHASAGGAIAVGGRVSAVVSTDPAGTLEAKVDFLLREAQRSQERVNVLEHEASAIRDEFASRDAAVRAELSAHAQEAIRKAMERYGWERRLGVLCLGVALILWTLSAFVS